MKNWIKSNKVKSLIWMLKILVVLLFAVLIMLFMKSSSGFNYWVWNDHGSVADWLSGAGTVAAIWVGFRQIKIQNRLDRAKTIESKRPRFDVKNAARISTNFEVIGLMIQHDSDAITSILKDKSKYKIQMINISESPVYDLAIKFTYINKNGEQQTDTFSFSGLMSSKRLVLIPEDYDISIKMRELVIKFMSSTGELGFCRYKSSEKTKEDFEHPKYYFVKASNKYVSGGEMGQIISKESQLFQELDFKPNYLNNRFVYPGNDSDSKSQNK